MCVYSEAFKYYVSYKSSSNQIYINIYTYTDRNSHSKRNMHTDARKKIPFKNLNQMKKIICEGLKTRFDNISIFYNHQKVKNI